MKSRLQLLSICAVLCILAVVRGQDTAEGSRGGSAVPPPLPPSEGDGWEKTITGRDGMEGSSERTQEDGTDPVGGNGKPAPPTTVDSGAEGEGGSPPPAIEEKPPEPVPPELAPAEVPPSFETEIVDEPTDENRTAVGEDSTLLDEEISNEDLSPPPVEYPPQSETIPVVTAKDSSEAAADAVGDDAEGKLYTADAPLESGALESLPGLSIGCLSCQRNQSSSALQEEDSEVVVYRDQELVGEWKSCAAEGEPGSDCFVETIYTDEIGFRMSYPVVADQLIADPEVSLVNGTGMRPFIDEFYLDDEDYVGAVTIKYMCDVHAETETVGTLEMRVKVSETETVRVRWLKKCGFGGNDRISVAYRTSAQDVLLPAPAADGAPTENGLLVADDDASTTFVLNLLPPARAQSYSTPVVEADSSIASVSVRGILCESCTLYVAGTRFLVLYSCRGNGTVKVVMRIPIPPFDDVVRLWHKECSVENRPLLAAPEAAGDSPAEGSAEAVGVVLKPLNIGTSYGEADVMSAGQPSESHSIAFESGLEAQEHHARIPRSVLSVTFFASNPSESTTAHVIDGISCTVKDPKILIAEVRSLPGLLTRAYMTAEGGEIAPGETTKFEIHFICKDAGSSAVLVTMASLHHEQVEFGFVKECHRPVRITQNGTFRTAKSLLNSVLFLIALVLGVSVYYYRSSSAGKGAAMRSYSQAATPRTR